MGRGQSPPERMRKLSSQQREYQGKSKMSGRLIISGIDPPACDRADETH